MCDPFFPLSYEQSYSTRRRQDPFNQVAPVRGIAEIKLVSSSSPLGKFQWQSSHPVQCRKCGDSCVDLHSMGFLQGIANFDLDKTDLNAEIED